MNVGFINETENKKRTSQHKKPANARKLGRGLSALLGQDFATPPSQPETPLRVPPTSANHQVLSLPIEWLKPNAHQPRRNFSQEQLQELADSLKTHHFLQPIVARQLGQKAFEIIAGERRWRAAQIANIDRVPVIVKKADEIRSAEWALVENIQREDLNVIEEAQAFQKLLDSTDMTQQDLAMRMGQERASVANKMRLLQLHPAVQEMVKQNKISFGQAKLLLQVTPLAQQLRLAQTTIRQGLTVRRLEREIKVVLKDKAPIARETADSQAIQLKYIQEQLEKCLGTKVGIDYSKGKGFLSIRFSTDAQLNHIVEKLSRPLK